MAVYHLYCGSNDADIAEVADPALGRYQSFTKATDLRRQAYRDPVAYKDWKGFFENRQTITLDQMKASRAVIGRPEECIERVGLLAERFGVTYMCFEVNFGALSHAKVVEFDGTVCNAGDAAFPWGLALSEDKQTERLDTIAGDRAWMVMQTFIDRPAPTKKDRRPGELALIEAIRSGGVETGIDFGIARVGCSLTDLVAFISCSRRLAALPLSGETNGKFDALHSWLVFQAPSGWVLG